MSKRKQEEAQPVGRSLIVLCMTLVFIYVLFFGMHEQELKQLAQATQQQLQYVSQPTGSVSTILEENAPSISSNSTSETPTSIISPVDTLTASAQTPSPRPVDSPGRKFYSFDELFDTGNSDSVLPEGVDKDDMIPLSGTFLREGTLKSAAMIELDQYTLYTRKNIENTHYVFLGDYRSDISSVVTRMGGNVVEISDKNAIKDNQLFGDKIQFINLPQYDGVKVLFIVHFESTNDVWFIQIDKDIYYQRKVDMQKTFDTWYDR